MKMSRTWFLLLCASVLVVGFGTEAMAQSAKLADLIAKTPQGTGPGQIDPSAAPGFLGIPGAPQVSVTVSFLWAMWVGWIFSTVGAFGGIMAAIGHINVYGLGNYAKTFGKSAMGKTLTDSIKASNQFVAGMSAAITSFNYWRLGRLVLPLGLALGVGSLLGAWTSANFFTGKLDFKVYQGYFGLFVLVLGAFLTYQITPAGQASKKKAKDAARAFEDAVKKQRAGDVTVKPQGVITKRFTLTHVEFSFYGVEFSFNPILPFLGGFVIAGVAALLGVGGGFLLVPYLTSVSQLPMYLAAGTSGLAVLISMITSLLELARQGVPMDFSMIGPELIGVFLGSVIGPYTSKYLPERVLQIIFIILAFYVGTDYTLQGFFGIKML